MARRFEIRVPDDQEGGAYSNVQFVWSTNNEFTIDFGITLPPKVDEEGHQVIPTRVVARLKITPMVASGLARAIDDHIRAYEKAFGPIPIAVAGGFNVEIPDDIRELTGEDKTPPEPDEDQGEDE